MSSGKGIKSVAFWGVLFLAIVAMLILIPSQSFPSFSIAGDQPAPPDGYKWCKGYIFLDDRLLPKVDPCPTEYLCMNLTTSFTTEAEARTACPDEWVIQQAAIIPEQPVAQSQSLPVVPIIVVVAAVAAIIVWRRL